MTNSKTEPYIEIERSAYFKGFFTVCNKTCINLVTFIFCRLLWTNMSKSASILLVVYKTVPLNVNFYFFFVVALKQYFFLIKDTT